MTQIILYGLKNCDTCKKALKALETEGIMINFVDIRAEANLSEKVPLWLSTAGADLLINRRSTTWRNLDESQRAGAPETLLIAHPTLIKRPIIEIENKVHVGWGKDSLEKLA